MRVWMPGISYENYDVMLNWFRDKYANKIVACGLEFKGCRIGYVYWTEDTP